MRHLEEEGDVGFVDAVVGAAHHVDEDAGAVDGLADLLGGGEVVVGLHCSCGWFLKLAMVIMIIHYVIVVIDVGVAVVKLCAT